MRVQQKYRNFDLQTGFLLFLFVLIGNSTYGQFERQNFRGYLVGMTLGLNFTDFTVDTATVSPALLPNVGLNIEKPVRGSFSARLALGYARRGVNSSDNIWEYRNDYFDMQFQARYKLGNYLKLSAGVQNSIILGSYVKIYDSYNFLSFRWESTQGFLNQWELQAGLSVAVAKGFDLEAHYRFGAAGYDYQCLQFGVNVYVSELKRKRKLNKFTSMADARENPFAVEKLVLHREGLTEIPPEVFSLVNLQELVLDGNEISELPPEIGQLSQLKILSVQYNNLSLLPPEIGKLKKLKEFRLRNNKLKSLPKEIGSLTALQFLYIGKNSLESLPEELGLLESLIELDVANSGVLLELPSSMQGLNRLEKIYLDRTTIVPYSLGNFNPRLQIYYR